VGLPVDYGRVQWRLSKSPVLAELLLKSREQTRPYGSFEAV